MATNKIDPSRTALFLLDLQVIYAKQDPKFEALMQHIATVVQQARSHGLTIAYCRAAFNEAEVAGLPDTNRTFSVLKHDPSRAALFHVDSPAAAYHAALAPQPGDIVVRKNRVGPFLNAPQDVDAIFRERGIDTLVLSGVSTGGAVVAAVVQASDLDYRLFVLENCCADTKVETHEFLMDFFKKRGDVIQSGELAGLIQ